MPPLLTMQTWERNMFFLRSWFPFHLFIIGSLWGCSVAPPVPSSFSSPLFTPTAEDIKRVAALAHELDKRALHCLAVSSCEAVHFSRGLVSLFESQEAAGASFRRVIDVDPSSALAASSVRWLHLIETEGSKAAAGQPQNTSIELMGQLIRDWMARELAEYSKQARITATAPKAKVEPVEMVQALQKQVRERDRHIATLEAKLEALKVIDQDHEKMKRAIKVPVTLP
jgi:hypothetical protein